MISTVKKVLCILISLLFVFIVPAKEVVTMSNEIAEPVFIEQDYGTYEYETVEDFYTISESSAVVKALKATITAGSNISERLLSEKNMAVPSLELGSSGNVNTIYIEETASVEETATAE